MTDDDVVAWITVIALIGLVCVVTGAWSWLGRRRQRRNAMRQFWRR